MLIDNTKFLFPGAAFSDYTAPEVAGATAMSWYFDVEAPRSLSDRETLRERMVRRGVAVSVDRLLGPDYGRGRHGAQAAHLRRRL